MRLLVIGGSDAGIAAALRARELHPSVEATVVVADAFPDFSIRGLPYYPSGDVADWRELAYRTTTDLEAASPGRAATRASRGRHHQPGSAAGRGRSHP